LAYILLIGHQENGMGTANMSGKGTELTTAIIGVWSLLSREDHTDDGRRVVDPSLGMNPLGILTYAPKHFAAQFMKRDRSGAENSSPDLQGENNTGAIGGYDAYFGTYRVFEETGEVLHHLQGALTVDNVGLEVSRKLEVIGDQLTIQLDTTSAKGIPISRVLTWQRVG
jgi:lipocalin-like protein